MIVSRSVYDAVLHIQQEPADFDPANPLHQTALDAGVAEVHGDRIELTHKGELVLGL
ncbi:MULTISPECIES: hypothetical protein [unclassified Pigmentiphaga]|uniref:hypothetical protein n=1 Tax=unclassified Pigmentiphaga TaxID=2626614 RepID=UPI001404C55F|nr:MULTISPECIES: hypothetical protein [unclassified Pigmentiphaga]